MKRPKKDIIEIFGYSPDDISSECRSLWNIQACPFINKKCIKHNHDQTVIYGVCSVTSPYGECVVCPNRLYEDNYSAIKKLSGIAFGKEIPFLTFDEYIPKREKLKKCVVALGTNSGKEVKLGRQLSMDWVLALIEHGDLREYTGIEVQSIDITGNYRDCWYAYKNFQSEKREIPSSRHGLNWANVHKRLIPQIIRKGLMYSRSSLVKHGLFFITPTIVYRKFEDIIGADIPNVKYSGPDIITVHTYGLSPSVTHGQQKNLFHEETHRFHLEEFSKRFITGPNLPQGDELDNAVRSVLFS